MAIVPSVAMVVSWPAIETRSFDFSTFSFRETPFGEAKEKAEEAQNDLRDWLDAARHYAQAMAAGSTRVERDLKLEALGPLLSGELPMIVEANAARDIEAAVTFAEEQGLRMILVGGAEAWKVKELLAEKDVPVILGLVASLPDREDDPYDRPFQTAGELAAAGVTIAIGTGAGGGFGPGGPHESRTLPFEIGMATAYGLSEEDAIKALTINPARMYGLGDRLGSIEAGKIANLIVTDGSPLEITTQIRHVIIAGREVPLDNKHLALYERYRSRPAR
jgi:imidazolonepropionase-like amidohydrolase